MKFYDPTFFLVNYYKSQLGFELKEIMTIESYAK